MHNSDAQYDSVKGRDQFMTTKTPLMVNMAETVKRDSKMENRCSRELLYRDQPAPNLFASVDQKQDKKSRALVFKKMTGRLEKY